MLDIISKTNSQVQNKIPLNLESVITPFIPYTCPAGKRALIRGSVQCVNRGAAGNVQFRANGIIVKQWGGGLGSTNFVCDNSRNLAVNMLCPIEVELDAGQNISFTQNIGTNAETKIFVNIEELPA